MLRIDLIGNLGSDPEVRTTQTHRELLQFRVAINQRHQTADGRWEDAPAEWFRVRAMGNQLERARGLGKGDRVFVAGRLDITHYTAHDGEARVGYEVWADEISALSRRAQADDGRDPAGAASGDGAYEPAEDLPF
jgi:single-strand DNA-binding protein